MQHRPLAATLMLLVAATALVGRATARAEEQRTIRVPQDFPTIQEALDAAGSGDTVLIDNGVWRLTSALRLYDKNSITMESVNGAESCIVTKGDRSTSGLLLRDNRHITLRGISFAGLIFAIDISSNVHGLDVADCVFRENGQAIVNFGGAGSEWRIERSLFVGNAGATRGAAVSTELGGNVEIRNCQFIANIAGNPNSVDPGVGGAIYAGQNSDVRITGSSFHSNQAVGNPNFGLSGGGAIACSRSSNVTIDNVLLTENAADVGGAVYVVAGANVTVIQASLSDNTARTELGGGGVFATNAYAPVTVEIQNSVLWKNVPNQIIEDLGAIVDVQHSLVEGGWPGTGNLDRNPHFATGPRGDYYLSHRKAGQKRNSPCINAGEGTANELGLKRFTTRTDGRPDKLAVDMGYHYPR